MLAFAAWYFLKPKEQQPQYITAEVSRGDIESAVLATGVLEATKMVSVGAQVSGQVKKMYVQLGDQVKQGQLIAQIDSVRQENEFKTAQASIKNQQAQLGFDKPISPKSQQNISVNKPCMRKMRPHVPNLKLP